MDDNTHWLGGHRRHNDTPEWARHEFRQIREAIEESTLTILAAINASPPSGGPASAVISFTIEGVPMSDISVPDTQGTIPATAAFQDADGNSDSPTGSVTWASSDETIATVDSSADPSGITAVVTVVGALGTAAISATDSGSGVSGSSNLTVEAGPPATATVTFG